jgi:hypothetical protein
MKRFMIGVTFAVTLSSLPVARATTMIALDLKQLADKAERVVLAVVEKSESRWTSDHSAIFTEVTLRIERSYKGDGKAGDTFVVRREGGVVDGIGMRVFGAPGFEPGEEVVIFTEYRGSTSRWVVGMSQGKLRVITDASGKKQVGAPDLRDVHLIPAPGKLPAVETRVRSLADFERDLRAILTTRAPK